jgi:hypothetical protein
MSHQWNLIVAVFSALGITGLEVGLAFGVGSRSVQGNGGAVQSEGGQLSRSSKLPRVFQALSAC